MRRVLAALGIVLALSSCREAPADFDPDNFGPVSDTAGIRLTYSPYPDHAPAFIAETDSLIYTAASFPGLPIESQGVLLSLPRAGGTVRVALPQVQLGSSVSNWLSTPALTRDGQRIAFFQLNVVPLPECASLACPVSFDTSFSQPELVSGLLRVRATTSNGSDVAT